MIYSIIQKGKQRRLSFSYQNELVSLLKNKKTCDIDNSLEETIINKLSVLTSTLYKNLEELGNLVLHVNSIRDISELAHYYRNSVFMCITEIRLIIDELETLIAKKYWRMPTYSELLYSINRTK